MMAWLKAARDYYDAMIGKPVRTEVINIMTRHLRVKDRALYDKMAWIFLDPNGTIIKENLREQQDWFSRHGLVPKKADLDALVNETYLKNALEKLGLHPCEKCPR